MIIKAVIYQKVQPTATNSATQLVVDKNSSFPTYFCLYCTYENDYFQMKTINILPPVVSFKMTFLKSGEQIQLHIYGIKRQKQTDCGINLKNAI